MPGGEGVNMQDSGITMLESIHKERRIVINSRH